MRSLPHKLAVDMIRRQFDSLRPDLEEFMTDSGGGQAKAMAADNAYYFRGNVRTALELAKIEFLFDASPAEVVALLRRVLPRVKTVTEMGQGFDEEEVVEFLAAALLAGEKEMTEFLARLPRKIWSSPEIQVSEINLLRIEAEQAGALGDRKKFQDLVKRLRPALDPKKLIVSPRSEAARFTPIVGLLEAVVSGKQAAVDVAWKAQGDAWKKAFGRPSERANRDGILDFEALGIARIARNFKMTVPSTNPYAPVELLDAGEKP